MKKAFLVLLVLAALLSTSCIMHYVSLSDMGDKDYRNYVGSNTTTSTYSPIEYNVLYGGNPANDYNWFQVHLVTYVPKPFQHYYYKGNPAELFKAAYPEASVIMTYGGYYFVGTKKKD